jgi:hypothetical protein
MGFKQSGRGHGRRKDQIVLGVDLDGVCADFYGRMREIAAEWFERQVDELTEDVSYGLPEWGIDPESPSNMRVCIASL